MKRNIIFPTEAAIVAKEAAKDAGIPVVFNCAFIEDVGLIDSIQSPGGNISGVRYPGPDIAAKRLEILLQIAPKTKTIWIPYIKGYPSIPSQMAAINKIGKLKGIKFIEAPMENPGQVDESLKKYGSSIDAILTLAEPVSVTPPFFEKYVKFAFDKKILLGGALYNSGGYGSIFGVNMDIKKSGEQSAEISAKILNGTKAGTIPVVSAYNFIEIDYKRATDQGYKIPTGLIKQANNVIR